MLTNVLHLIIRYLEFMYFLQVGGHSDSLNEINTVLKTE